MIEFNNEQLIFISNGYKSNFKALKAISILFQ